MNYFLEYELLDNFRKNGNNRNIAVFAKVCANTKSDYAKMEKAIFVSNLDGAHMLLYLLSTGLKLCWREETVGNKPHW